MNKTVNLNSLKSEKYIDLSTNLNELLFAYWNLLKSESENDSAKYLSLIYEIVKTLNLSDEIKNISFENDTSYIGGYYDFEEKKINFKYSNVITSKKIRYTF